MSCCFGRSKAGGKERLVFSLCDSVMVPIKNVGTCSYCANKVTKLLTIVIVASKLVSGECGTLAK